MVVKSMEKSIKNQACRKETGMYNKTVSKMIWIGLMAFCLASCGARDVGGPPPDIKGGVEQKYVIGPEDVLRIYVWRQENLSVTVPVRSDGKISIPLVNDIQAAGLTPEELRKEIAGSLAKFVEDPSVSVIVEAINSLRITVSGNVNAPGVQKVGGKISLLEAISRAGGVSGYADAKRIRIVRQENGSKKIYQANYQAILDGEDMTQNIAILPGDSIIVP